MTTADTRARPVHHGPGAAAANRTEKALLIGLFCWNHSITSDDISSLAAAGLTAEQRRLARAAGESNPPSPRSWGEAIAALAKKEVHAHHNPQHPLSVRTGPDRREEFIPAHLWSASPAEVEEHLSEGIGADQVIVVVNEAEQLEQLEDEHPEPPADAPKGWHELCALGPIPAEKTTRRCVWHPRRLPVVVTLGGPQTGAYIGRCAACPPRRAEFEVDVLTMSPPNPPKDWRAQPTGRKARKDGWGVDLDWAPKPHHRCSLPRKCHCGRPCAGETVEEN